MFIEKLSIEHISTSIINSFNHLPFDRYTKGDFNYRRRRFHSGKISKESQATVWDLEPSLFKQSLSINKYAGGVERQFPAINVEVRKYIAEHVLLQLLALLPPANNYQVGLHQIRVISDEEHMGKPAPEGIHQDGFDYIAVFCINKKNISGGDSIIVNANNYDDLKYEIALNPGEIILFDDRIYAHYVSAITPKLPGDAHRDVFVITFKEES